MRTVLQSGWLKVSDVIPDEHRIKNFDTLAEIKIYKSEESIF